MILPSSDYHATHITVPADLYTGADRVLHGLVGLYRRYFQFGKNLLHEAEIISEEALKLKHASDRMMAEKLTAAQDLFRRNDAVPWEKVKEAMTLLVEMGDRVLGMRAYPVQIMGALILYRGCLAEMATGEGKTLTACFPAILNSWTKNPCHLVTVNEYLAGRDADAMRALYASCGVSVGWVSSAMSPDERRRNYHNGVVYTTSKELVADFLRDRLQMGAVHDPSRRLLRRLLDPGRKKSDGMVMNGLHSVIVDEADSVLIDEAVTPLIISKAQKNRPLTEACQTAHSIAKALRSQEDYSVNRRYKEIRLTKAGYEKVSQLSRDLTGIWQGEWRRVELVEQALTARELYLKDKQYVVQGGKVVIVDEFTGRLMPNRSWRQGLHQAVEAKEQLEPTDPSETMSRLSFQRFFRFFRKLSGMTGTAREARGEFWHIYGLNVQPVPTNKPCLRKTLPDAVFPTSTAKWEAICQTISQCHETGRPILVGTKSLKESERLAAVLAVEGYEFSLLNAVHHKEEAAIIAKAGEPGMITIATNMAGRGTDIKLGRGVAELGGLHVVATERNESGRIDRQLFGRCARQGDPGSAQAFTCPEDELIERFLPGKMCRGLTSALERRSPGAEKLGEKAIAIAQKAAQRQAYRQRRQVLQMDTWLDDALSFTGSMMEF